jgi:hypothetical protein
VTDGLYALARHPQYTGLFIALFGEGVVHWPTLFSVGLLPIIIFIYYRLSKREELAVIKEFGEEYIEYQISQFITPERMNFSSGALMAGTVLAIDTIWYIIIQTDLSGAQLYFVGAINQRLCHRKFIKNRVTQC